MAYYYKRNTNIYISKADNASADATNTVQLNVADFAYNKQSITENVGTETIDPTQKRIVAPHVAIVSPVTFSFTTYMSPLVDTNVTSPEEYLWVSLVGVDLSSGSSTPTTSTFDFADGNVQELQNLTIWFDQPTQSEGNYRLDNAIVDSARISFSLNEIAQIEWSGRALSITEDNTPPASTDRTGNNTCLVNKLSTISLDIESPNATSYTLALTGGQVFINNNNTFYGKQQLGKTTVPEGSYTGNRVISGDLDIYMKSGTNESVDLFNVILNNITADTWESDYNANITINIGGSTAPFVQLNVPRAVLELGRQEFGELISVSIPFTAKEDTNLYSSVVYNMP
jgi:hypothetical protein